MVNKDETIAIRVTERKRDEIQSWAEERNLTEADAVRQMIDQALYDQRRIDELHQHDDVMARLEEIEEQIKQVDKRWWVRLFKRHR